eukprot:870316_1
MAIRKENEKLMIKFDGRTCLLKLKHDYLILNATSDLIETVQHAKKDQIMFLIALEWNMDRLFLQCFKLMRKKEPQELAVLLKLQGKLDDMYYIVDELLEDEYKSSYFIRFFLEIFHQLIQGVMNHKDNRGTGIGGEGVVESAVKVIGNITRNNNNNRNWYFANIFKYYWMITVLSLCTNIVNMDHMPSKTSTIYLWTSDDETNYSYSNIQCLEIRTMAIQLNRIQSQQPIPRQFYDVAKDVKLIEKTLKLSYAKEKKSNTYESKVFIQQLLSHPLNVESAAARENVLLNASNHNQRRNRGNCNKQPKKKVPPVRRRSRRLQNRNNNRDEQGDSVMVDIFTL